jgi:hypothetical protein
MMPAIAGVMGADSASGGPLFLDTFTDADNTDLFTHTPEIPLQWQTLTGEPNSYKIVGNQLSKPLNLGYSSYDPVVVPSGVSDCIITCDMKTNNSNHPAVVFRTNDIDIGPSYWLLNLVGFKIQLYHANPGYSLKGSYDGGYIIGDWHTFVLKLEGPSIIVYHDGIPVIDIVSSLDETRTMHGIGGYNALATARWDNFKIEGL